MYLLCSSRKARNYQKGQGSFYCKSCAIPAYERSIVVFLERFSKVKNDSFERVVYATFRNVVNLSTFL